MNEQQFHADVDKLFLSIEHWLEQSSSALDFESQAGILTIELPDASQIILSRQTILQEVWLASPLGAYHFQFTKKAWVTKLDQSLLPVLVDIISQKANISLDISQFQYEEF